MIIEELGVMDKKTEDVLEDQKREIFENIRMVIENMSKDAHSGVIIIATTKKKLTLENKGEDIPIDAKFLSYGQGVGQVELLGTLGLEVLPSLIEKLVKVIKD